MNVGVFGGSFNPPHVGHLWAATYGLAMGDLDKVLIVPCYKHAYGKQIAPFNHRMTMCEKLFKNFPKIETSQVEMFLSMKYDKPNLTIDTLEFLKEQHGYNISLIVGADIYKNVNNWYKYKKILKIAKVLLVPREDKLVSSTNVREEIKNNRIPDKILTPSVIDYIIQNNLYGAQK